eukprot:1193714-Prorocentrum_minimum.AAC.2
MSSDFDILIRTSRRRSSSRHSNPARLSSASASSPPASPTSSAHFPASLPTSPNSASARPVYVCPTSARAGPGSPLRRTTTASAAAVVSAAAAAAAALPEPSGAFWKAPEAGCVPGVGSNLRRTDAELAAAAAAAAVAAGQPRGLVMRESTTRATVNTNDASGEAGSATPSTPSPATHFYRVVRGGQLVDGHTMWESARTGDPTRRRGGAGGVASARVRKAPQGSTATATTTTGGEHYYQHEGASSASLHHAAMRARGDVGRADPGGGRREQRAKCMSARAGSRAHMG